VSIARAVAGIASGDATIAPCENPIQREREEQFLMILTDVETQQIKPGDPGFAERMAAYVAFGQLCEELGVMRGGAKLRPTSVARTVRVRNGKVVVTDGPFAETKEQIGGFYLLECRDLDQALELAAKIPTVLNGSVEVRPLWEW
jgi:hypothetical protein